MKCPLCNSEAIGFLKWIQKRYAFRTDCNNCGAHLKAICWSMLVYVGFVITVLVSISTIPYLDEIYNFLGFELEPKKLKIVIIFPVMLLGGVIIWFARWL